MQLIRLAISRPIFVTMVTLFMLVLGLIGLKKLPVDLYPSVSYPVLVVKAELPGAAPEELEQLVTQKLEDTLSTISGIQTLRSVSREGVAIVLMEFEMSTDVRFQEIQVRGKIANLRKSLPANMTEPVIFRQDPDDTPIIEIAVTGDRTAAELSTLAEQEIARKFRQISGVGEVDLSGTRNPEIHVDLNPQALDLWHINSRDVLTAIQKNNRNDPVGALQGENRIWLLRSLSQAKSVHELGEIVVTKNPHGIPIFLKDIASINSGFAEVQKTSAFGNREGLKPAVLVSVLKQSGENTVEISNKVRASLKEIASALPGDIQTTITRDNAELVRNNVADVFESLYLGAFLTILVVLLFLRSLRSTVTTGLSLPSSVITTFAIMAVAGFTVNVMTLLSLSLAIGLLVDDAIVVRENIFRHLHEGILSAKESAVKGGEEVALAVVATSLTLVAVFLPVGFMGGLSGQFFKQFALTVVFAMMVSLWDALTMAPMLSAYFANIPNTVKEWEPFGKVGLQIHALLEKGEASFEHLAKFYQRILQYLVPRPWIAGLIAILAMGTAGLGFHYVKKSFLPSQLGEVFSAHLNGPLAVPPQQANEVAKLVEKKLHEVESLENWSITSGVNSSGSAMVDMTLRIKPGAAKDQTALGAIRHDVRKILQGIPGYYGKVSEPADPLSGSTGKFQPLAVSVLGDDINQLREIGRLIRTKMVETRGVVDVALIQDEGLPEIRFETNQTIAGQYGITAQAISDTLQTWVKGDANNFMHLGDQQIPIVIRMENGKYQSPEMLLSRNYYVKGNTPKTDISVPLVQLGSWKPGSGPSVINRENRERILKIGANLAPGAALGNIVDSLRDSLAEIALPSGYTLRISGQNEQMDELFSNVLWAIFFGAIFVYMILASLFESFLQPLTVMAAIPLASTGAVLALWGWDLPLDLYGGIGMILLAGIVAKNSILLVDFAMQRVRESSLSPQLAILETAPLRLRPILMTSIAMIAGMIPIALGLGSGGAARQTLGIATIGGVLSSTFLTLLIVPNLYVIVERLRRKG